MTASTGDSLAKCLRLEQRVVNRIGGALFAYLFHRINQRELTAYIDDREISDKVLYAVRRDGYILKNCKTYAWAYHVARTTGDKISRLRYGIAQSDVKLLQRLNLQHLTVNHDVWTPDDLDQVVQDTLECQAMHQHIGKFISKKLLFLIRSYGVPRDDLETEMRAWAIRAIYMTFPRFESLLHVTNAAKAAIHNCGINQIQHYTSPSRQRLQKTAEGVFEAKHVAYDTLAHVAVDNSERDDLKDKLVSLVALAERKGMRQDVQRFLLCCAGQHDEGFSEFLGVDNSSLIEEISYPRYLKKAQKHFSFTETQVQKLFEKLRTQLS
jgi:hypothetical protein